MKLSEIEHEYVSTGRKRPGSLRVPHIDWLIEQVKVLQAAECGKTPCRDTGKCPICDEQTWQRTYRFVDDLFRGGPCNIAGQVADAMAGAEKIQLTKFRAETLLRWAQKEGKRNDRDRPMYPM